jgi:hypothetical protein
MKNKFIKTAKAGEEKEKSELLLKLDRIACLCADEVLGESVGEPEGLSLDAKLGALKTLTAYYAMVSKVEPPEELGNGFEKYRKGVTASGSGRGSSTRDFDLSGEVE